MFMGMARRDMSTPPWPFTQMFQSWMGGREGTGWWPEEYTHFRSPGFPLLWYN